MISIYNFNLKKKIINNVNVVIYLVVLFSSSLLSNLCRVSLLWTNSSSSFCTSSLFVLQNFSRKFLDVLPALYRMPRFQLKSHNITCRYRHNITSWECATLTPNDKIKQVFIFLDKLMTVKLRKCAKGEVLSVCFKKNLVILRNQQFYLPNILLL